MRRFITLSFLFIMVFISCRQSKKDPEKSEHELRWEKEKRLDSLNFNEANRLSKVNNAITGWDTVNKFTYSIQELFESEKRPVSFIGEIKDIIKKDSLYILKIAGVNSYLYNQKYVAEISVTRNRFQELKRNLENKGNAKGCFIFQDIILNSHLPILSSEVQPDGDDIEDASSHLTFDFDEYLVSLQGNLIAYFIYDKLKKDEEE